MDKIVGHILLDWCPLCGCARRDHGINGCKCGCPKKSSEEQQHRDEERMKREREKA